MSASDRPLVQAWEGRGTYRTLAGFETFTVDVPPSGPETLEPLLVIHGFPTSSIDFAAVVDVFAAHRRVLLFDMIGYGLSAKPDRHYTVALQADVVQDLVGHAGITRLAMLTHDLGDTVGGELLARQMEGRWPVEITRRLVTNGSIYIEMAHLSAGQLFLLGLPDEQLPPDTALEPAAMRTSLAATFADGSATDTDALAASVELVFHHDGHRLLPRTIRYIEERRANEARFTGAIETHVSPLSIVWGTEDPIAVRAMATRLHAVRPDSALTWLDGIGHYPMLEAPDAFGRAVASALE